MDLRRMLPLTLVVTLAGLTGCGGGSGSSATPASGYAQLRFIHGSPDAGSVDVGIDSTVVLQGQSYGTVTGFASGTPEASGAHTIYVYAAGNDTAAGTLASVQESFTAGAVYTVVLAGEKSPKSGPQNLSIQFFNETFFATASGSAAVNFHNASPAETAVFSSTAGSVPFGYAPISSPASAVSLGNAAFGAATGPVALPSSTATTATVFFAAGGAGSISVDPSQINPADSGNVLPFASNPNLSLYLVDGPASSNAPSPGITGTDIARFFGSFDPNGA